MAKQEEDAVLSPHRKQRFLIMMKGLKQKKSNWRRCKLKEMTESPPLQPEEETKKKLVSDELLPRPNTQSPMRLEE